MYRRFMASTLACLLIFGLAGCFSTPAPATTPGTTEVSATAPSQVQTSPTETTVVTQPTEQTQPTEPHTSDFININTCYGPLTFPNTYSFYLNHQEVTEGDTVTEYFYMVYQDTQIDLFRIEFGADMDGTLMGAFSTENGEIPIYVSVHNHNDTDFTDPDAYIVYCGLMEGLDFLISSIWDHPQFTDLKDIHIQEQEKEVTYWYFSLPENMELEESQQNGYYLATFYGIVNGVKYKLYSLAVGDPALDSVLGMYTIDGVSRLVSVENYELPDMDGWTDRDMGELYTMMGSINNVIQTIMASEGFSAEIPT